MRILGHRTIHRDSFAYCAHPHLVVTARGTWLLVFNRAPRRKLVLHPPQDPEFRNVLVRSLDEGRSWSAPEVVPSYVFSGVECAGLTALRDGRVLLNQWRFDWVPLGLAQRPENSGLYAGPEQLMQNLALSPEIGDFSGDSLTDPAERFPWARGSGETLVHISDDDGRSFEVGARIDTDSFSGGYGMRGALELADGTLVLPLSDVPSYRTVFVLRSRDRGRTWFGPIHAASGDGHEFEEPSGLVLRDGTLLLVMRDNVSRLLHAVRSHDGGMTWSVPMTTGIPDYPAHLSRLRDGCIACVAGRRVPPFGIRLYLSDDDGATWRETSPVRDDLPSKDLGYPTVAQRENGTLVVVYYARSPDGVTGIEQTEVRAD